MEETTPRVLADVPERLAELDGLSLEEQLERYDALHRDIADGLAQVDETATEGHEGQHSP